LPARDGHDLVQNLIGRANRLVGIGLGSAGKKQQSSGGQKNPGREAQQHGRTPFRSFVDKPPVDPIDRCSNEDAAALAISLWRLA
jgi:hypothetical protein